ncbi:MAG: DNA repair protein RecN [Butyrivibrio sp.]|nr:DNA repair protein RecN [Butyrivibrio sp.]
MLLNLHVKNLALVEEAEIEFGRGLNILTGETGAGKSIILGAVNLALGAKAGSESIGRFAESAVAELTFSIEDAEKIKALNEMEIYPEDGTVTVTRRIMPGRSLIKVNGETVTAALVKKITALLIDIHGQHDHQSLLYKSKHLEILDKYARLETESVRTELADAYSEYRAAAAELQKFSLDEEERNRSISFLRYEIDEIDGAALCEGEDESVEAEYRRITNAQKIAEAVDAALKLTDGGQAMGAGELIGRAYSSLSPAMQYDGNLEALLSQLSDIDSLLSDFNRELSDYASGLMFDREKYESVEKRLDLINGLKAKYGATLGQIASYREKAQEKLDFYEEYEQNLEKAKRGLETSKERLRALCAKLTRLRRDAAKRLSEAVTDALCDLNFEQVRFEIELRETETLSANGSDEAEFMISLNPGEALRPLAKIASGGELSRIMLGIKSALAVKDETDTLIFDEIDSGISGRTAQKVSEKMALIAKEQQVICITHLPQIASMADIHFLIEKNVEGGFTKTSIKRLDEGEIAKELARMLGGKEITQIVMENARQMKELANEIKQK